MRQKYDVIWYNVPFFLLLPPVDFYQMKRLLTSLLFGVLFFAAYSQAEHYARQTFPYSATAEERQMLKTWYRNVSEGPLPTAPVTDIAVYQQAMPGYTVVPAMQSSYRPWQNTDAPHCRTHELADPEMLYIKHHPLLGELDLPTHAPIHAEIKALGGQSLVCDSLLVHYRIFFCNLNNDQLIWV